MGVYVEKRTQDIFEHFIKLSEKIDVEGIAGSKALDAETRSEGFSPRFDVHHFLFIQY